MKSPHILSLIHIFPELKSLYKQAKKPCVIDGELHVFQDGKSDFFAIQRRTLTSDPFRIRQHSKKFPAVFTAFDKMCIRDSSCTV